jgi:hypothetical protein
MLRSPLLPSLRRRSTTSPIFYQLNRRPDSLSPLSLHHRHHATRPPPPPPSSHASSQTADDDPKVIPSYDLPIWSSPLPPRASSPAARPPTAALWSDPTLAPDPSFYPPPSSRPQTDPYQSFKPPSPRSNQPSHLPSPSSGAYVPQPEDDYDPPNYPRQPLPTMNSSNDSFFSFAPPPKPIAATEVLLRPNPYAFAEHLKPLPPTPVPKPAPFPTSPPPPSSIPISTSAGREPCESPSTLARSNPNNFVWGSLTDPALQGLDCGRRADYIDDEMEGFRVWGEGEDDGIDFWDMPSEEESKGFMLLVRALPPLLSPSLSLSLPVCLSRMWKENGLEVNVH